MNEFTEKKVTEEQSCLALMDSHLNKIKAEKGQTYAACVNLLLQMKVISCSTPAIYKILPGVTEFRDLAIRAISELANGIPGFDTSTAEAFGAELTGHADRIYEQLYSEFPKDA